MYNEVTLIKEGQWETSVNWLSVLPSSWSWSTSHFTDSINGKIWQTVEI